MKNQKLPGNVIPVDFSIKRLPRSGRGPAEANHFAMCVDESSWDPDEFGKSLLAYATAQGEAANDIGKGN